MCPHTVVLLGNERGWDTEYMAVTQTGLSKGIYDFTTLNLYNRNVRGIDGDWHMSVGMRSASKR